MLELLWLFLPVAAATGWYSAYRRYHPKLPKNGREQGLEPSRLVSRKKTPAFFEKLLHSMARDEEDDFESTMTFIGFLRKKGEMEKAIRLAQNLIARPNLTSLQRSRGLLELGRSYQESGLLDRAEALYQELLLTHQMHDEAHRQLQIIYEQEQDWQQAIHHAQQINQSTSEQNENRQRAISFYYSKCGEKALSEFRYADAERLIDQSLEFYSSNLQGIFLKIDLLMYLQRYANAKKFIVRSIEQAHWLIIYLLPKVNEIALKLHKPQLTEQMINQYRSIIAQDVGATDFVIQYYQETKGLDFTLQYLQEMISNLKELGSNHFKINAIIQYLVFVRQASTVEENQLQMLIDALKSVELSETRFICQQCGYESVSLFWQCPGCKQWGQATPKEFDLST